LGLFGDITNLGDNIITRTGDGTHQQREYITTMPNALKVHPTPSLSLSTIPNLQSVMKQKTPLTITLRSVAAILAVFGVVASSQAAEITKANNADNLNLTTSWSGGVVPGSGDVARWNSTVSDVNNTTNILGANTNWSGIKIVDPAGPIVIITNASGNTLTLGASGIDMASASQDLTLSNGVALLAASAQTWSVGSGRLLTLAGPLTRASTGNSATLNFDTSLG
jgi:hypothetical protein